MKIDKKIYTFCLTAFILSSFICSVSITAENSLSMNETPQGVDLKNHFGTHPLDNKYGPKNSMASLVESNLDLFTPTNASAENREKLNKQFQFKISDAGSSMNPTPLKAGAYTNIAPSATGEINPEIANPKLKVSGTIEYPASLKVPVYTGMQNNFYNVLAKDKTTGEIVEEKVVIKSPNIVTEERVGNINRSFEQHYDLRTGELITETPKIKSFGLESVIEENTPKAPIRKEEECIKNKKLR